MWVPFIKRGLSSVHRVKMGPLKRFKRQDTQNWLLKAEMRRIERLYQKRDRVVNDEDEEVPFEFMGQLLVISMIIIIFVFSYLASLTGTAY